MVLKYGCDQSQQPYSPLISGCALRTHIFDGCAKVPILIVTRCCFTSSTIDGAKIWVRVAVTTLFAPD